MKKKKFIGCDKFDKLFFIYLFMVVFFFFFAKI